MSIYNYDCNKLVLDNTRLVHYLIKKMHINVVGGYDYDDIYQIGITGLIKAAKSYDGSVKFSTYASKCINNEIYMFFRNTKKYSGYVSLDEAIATDVDGNEITYGEVIEDPNSNFIDNLIELDLMEKALNIVLNVFSDRERLIFIYYILHKSQQYISEKFNLSQSYISRIEQKLLKKLKKYMDISINYEEVYHMNVSSKNCSLSFFTNDVNTFNKVILDIFKQDFNVRNYKISRTGNQIIVSFASVEEALDIIANLIDKIDCYSMVLKKTNICEQVETSSLNENTAMLKRQQDTLKDNDVELKCQTSSSIIREYFLSKSEFTISEILDKFPNYPRTLIQSAINYSKIKGQIEGIKRGVYKVIK